MKILLVRPKWSTPATDAPLGLAILASIARNLGHFVTIVDLNKRDLPEKRDYDVVGITGVSINRDGIKEIAHQFPNSTVIVGGPWATSCPEEALAEPDIDYVCVGEGEETWREFLTCAAHREHIKALGFKTSDGSYHLNPREHGFVDLDVLPLPAWDLVEGLCEYGRVPIWTSRGCPYQCCFCAVYQYFGRVWRSRKAENVVNEIEWLNKELGVKRFTIVDDNPNLQPDRLLRICNGIIEKKLKVVFDADGGLRVNFLPDELLIAMKKAGFKRININPESGSQRVLDDVIHKSLKLECLEPAVEKAVEVGLDVHAFFVIGFPSETMDEIEATIRLAHRLRELGASSYVGNAMPFPGTELYRRAKAEGHLRFDGEELISKIVYDGYGEIRDLHCLTSPHWEPEEIIAIHHAECKKDTRSSIKRLGLSKRGVKKLLRDPVDALRMLKHAI